ncbi:hypothetical protein HPB51_026532 [Rhipicephalus microplus]|uniref:Carrier domain-containing protein n=1 Tax=Rhipicephalus microplus TaxID=6941 RepID=A0A9J6D2U0_RHIMP|nr:hypothetical protein HPB51_026532 [Rhipicephalus microplus]
MSPTVTLAELGIDSLMSVEMKQLLERDFEVLGLLREYPVACTVFAWLARDVVVTSSAWPNEGRHRL